MDRSLDWAGCGHPIDGAARAHSGSGRTAGTTGPLLQPPPHSTFPAFSAAARPAAAVGAASENGAEPRVNYSGCCWLGSCLVVVVLDS